MKVVQRVEGFIVDEIESAEEKLNIRLSKYTKIYILDLLKRLCTERDPLNLEIIGDKPLAIVLMEAVRKDIFQKIRDLKAVGDISLIFSGLYPEYLTRRLVDIDYYIEIGKRSYHLLSDTYSNLNKQQDLFILYSQLVAEFITLIQILTEMASDLHFLDEENLIKIYNRYRRTKIRKYLEILRKHQIEPLIPNN